MNKQNIQQIIRELFREACNIAPEVYLQLDNGLVTNEATELAQDYAVQLYKVRNDDEIERDERAGVTEIDYVEWVMAELGELIPDAPTSNKFETWATEINKDWTPGYNATATKESLQVSFNSEEVARIDYNNGRYTVTGTDKEAVEQLEYMVNR